MNMTAQRMLVRDFICIFILCVFASERREFYIMSGDTGRKFRSAVLAVLTLSVSLSAVGCSHEKPVTEYGGEIAVICKAQGVQFWDAVRRGAEDGAEELNYTINYQATSNDTELNAQIKMVEEAIDNNVSAIVIAPNDTEGINVTLDKAVSKGIPVITVDSDVTYEGRLAYIGSDNVSAGAVAAREVMEQLPDGGDIAIIGHVEKSQTAIERINGFKEELAGVEVQKEIPVEDMNGEMKNAKIPDSKYHIVATKYCENELETANKQAKAILQNYPDVKLIYGTNENSTTGICDAVAEMGKAGEVKVIGFNASDKEVAYIQDGTLTGTIVQNPYNMGYLGVKYADSAVHGDTSDLLPELITSVTLVTEENLNNEDIRFLINPVTN